MKSATKKRTDQGASWSDESEASLVFFKQGEQRAAEEVLEYTHEVAQADRRRRRRWLLVVALVVALAAGVASAGYLMSS